MDHFCQQLDNSSSGILATLSHFSDILKVNDEQLWHHLEFTSKVEPFNSSYSSSILFKTHAMEPHEQVKPQFYAFRWITLLLTQEFKFESILRIWDTILSNTFGVQVSLSFSTELFGNILAVNFIMDAYVFAGYASSDLLRNATLRQKPTTKR